MVKNSICTKTFAQVYSSTRTTYNDIATHDLGDLYSKDACSTAPTIDKDTTARLDVRSDALISRKPRSTDASPIIWAHAIGKRYTTSFARDSVLSQRTKLGRIFKPPEDQLFGLQILRISPSSCNMAGEVETRRRGRLERETSEEGFFDDL